MATAFQPITIAVNFQGQQAPVAAGGGARTVGILGTAKQGPAIPFTGTASQVYAAFGQPNDPATSGYTIAQMVNLASLQGPSGVGPALYTIMRVGVALGTYAVLDASAGVTMTLKAAGRYAGSAAQNLQVSITINGATTKVSSLTFIDVVTSVPALTLVDINSGGFYDLSTNAKIVAAITAAQPPLDPNTIVQATIGASALTPVAVTNVSFSAGTDGKAATASDATIGGNGIQIGLLDMSLSSPIDYLSTSFDAAVIASTIVTHLAAAQGVGAFRKAYLGPALGSTYATLSGGTYLNSGLTNRRISVLGHDSLMAYNPAIGGLDQVAGSVAASTYAGLKATYPIQEAVIGFAVNGVQDVGTAPGKTAPLQPSDINALAGSRLMTYVKNPTSSDVTVRDALTTVPQTNTLNQINNDSFTNIPDTDDAVARVGLNAVASISGRPDPGSGTTTALIQTAITKGIDGLGKATNGIAQASVTRNSQSGYDLAIGYYAANILRNLNVNISNVQSS